MTLATFHLKLSIYLSPFHFYVLRSVATEYRVPGTVPR